MHDVFSPAFWSRFFTEFRCHHCGSEDGFVSRPRNLFEAYVLPLLALCPARCGDCFRRSYRPIRVPLLPRREGKHASDPAALPMPESATNVGVAEKGTSEKDTGRQRIA